MLYDSHAHLNNEDFTDEERAEFIANTQKAVDEGLLKYVNDVGFELVSSQMAVMHAEQYPWCYAVVGCHPHDAKGMDDTQLAMIKALARKPKVKAIGEIGLDFHYDLSDRDVQRDWFRKQIRLANELKMPIVIHAREADQEVMDILREEGAFSKERQSWFPKRPGPRGACAVRANADSPAPGVCEHSKAGSSISVMRTGGGAPGACEHSGGLARESDLLPDARVLLHCFSGSAELARQYIKLGATLSVAGPVTYKNNRKTVAVVEEIPVEFLLVETDSPYLAPVPMRGKQNMPPYVEYTARRVAEIKGMEFEELARITCENAERFFGIV